MKDSGVEWIGVYPANWRKIKLKHIYCASCAGEVIDRSYLHTGNELLYTCQREPMFSNFCNFPEAKRTGINDVLVTRNATPYIFIPENGSIYSNVVQRISLSDDFDKRYVKYSLQCGVDALVVQGDTIPSYNMQVWDNIWIPYLLLSEQHSIADYLDAKCIKIDAVITRQQEALEKLKAYKRSVITEVVTRGLDPDAPMKDSGIEFMGEVPEQWKMIRLKFLMSHIIDCLHETPNYSSDGEYLVIRTADEDFGFLRADEKMYRLTADEYQKRIRRLPLNKDDIVYGREGERWGLACLVPESDKYCLGQRMMQFRCNRDIILPEFAMWALNSRYIYLQGSVDTLGSTTPHVNISTMRNYGIPVPPLAEQKEIIDAIKKRTRRIDSEIKKRETLIDKLTEYKKSLIYEVVTGKRDI